jgi:hypothetical protein
MSNLELATRSAWQPLPSAPSSARAPRDQGYRADIDLAKLVDHVES